MRKRLTARLAAIGLMMCAGILAAPGCRIRIGPGTGATTDPGGGAGTGGTGGEAQTPEQQAADALAQIDPHALAVNEAVAGYAAYDTMGLVASSVSDPSALDEETLMQLIGQYAPTAFADANQWIASIDPTTLSAPPVIPAFEECIPSPYGCDGVISCDFAKVCVVTSCGTKGCGSCPDLYDLSKVAIKSWCGYTCMVGKDVVGIAIVFTSKYKNLKLTECFPNPGSPK